MSVKHCCQLRFHCCNACITQQQSTQINVQPISVCAKCGRTSDAKASCCAKGGSWRGQCGPPGDDNFEHTWGQGFEACKAAILQPTTSTISSSQPIISTTATSQTTTPMPATTDPVLQTSSGKRLTQAVNHIVSRSILENKNTTPLIPACAKCVRANDGKVTCCAKGASWEGKCGPPGNDNFEHTWGEGLKVCKDATLQPVTSLAATTTRATTDGVARATTPAFTSTNGRCLGARGKSVVQTRSYSYQNWADASTSCDMPKNSTRLLLFRMSEVRFRRGRTYLLRPGWVVAGQMRRISRQRQQPI